jgi:acid phosphatase
MRTYKMNALFFLIFIVAVGVPSFSPLGTGSREPRNLEFCKREVKEYVTSEKYMEDIEKVTTDAQQYIRDHLDPSKKNALVLDVDETSLSHLRYELDLRFGYSRSTWEEWVRKAEAAPITPTLDLFKWSRSRNIAVFFITGTTENLRESVTRNLRHAGYSSWDSLYMRAVGDHEPATSYKTKRREEITSKGYYIIVNIGDQESDLVGGYAEKTFKLPNPMYLVD